jgi:cell division protein FtsB
MLGLGWKAAIGLLLACGWLQYDLLSAESTIAQQQTEIVQYKSNNIKLESAVEAEKETIKTLITMNDKVGERLYELTAKSQEVFTENADLNEEINNLRQTEATLALEKPFARGNAASIRINTLMQLIAGQTPSTTSTDLHDTSTTKD